MQTLGEFYKEKVLPRTDLITKEELPWRGREDGVKIEHNLFEWRLWCGKEYIVCKSEYEARYLKVWVEAEVREIQIPKDEEFLKTIVPELEKLKQEIDEIIEDELQYVLRRRIKQQIISVAWRHITNYKDEEEDKEVKGKKKRKKKRK